MDTCEIKDCEYTDDVKSLISGIYFDFLPLHIINVLKEDGADLEICIHCSEAIMYADWNEFDVYPWILNSLAVKYNCYDGMAADA